VQANQPITVTKQTDTIASLHIRSRGPAPVKTEAATIASLSPTAVPETTASQNQIAVVATEAEAHTANQNQVVQVVPSQEAAIQLHQGVIVIVEVPTTEIQDQPRGQAVQNLPTQSHLVHPSQDQATTEVQDLVIEVQVPVVLQDQVVDHHLAPVEVLQALQEVEDNIVNYISIKLAQT
jgi:hypothetical protein